MALACVHHLTTLEEQRLENLQKGNSQWNDVSP